ncbi:PHA03325 superfamily incomplete domain containing protein [Pandoravirus celtis]|uniref:PHA03325 superfamily incomplete domain containing protein n=1 Tax=Pandoravirus celtis TaxID=2568002 RepID=A0A4D6EFD1_9VIRU|nr:PHA03325 superfamily incomplete domain containing protein [Pandoravirus celtis]QBZ80606.1 PHA03325 superfamily incomplete domain containing protein [Pandoravirus celtis]
MTTTPLGCAAPNHDRDGASAATAATPMVPVSGQMLTHDEQRQVLDQLRTLHAAGGAKVKRNAAAIYAALHRFHLHFVALRHRLPSGDNVPLPSTPAWTLRAADKDHEHGAEKRDDGETPPSPSYACFDDVCAHEAGLQRAVAHRCIKQMLIKGLFCEVVLAMGSHGRNDDVLLAAKVAPSSYRCFMGAVSEWSAPDDWIDWTPDALARWLEAPERALLVDALRSVWVRAKAKAGRGSGGLQIRPTRRNIEAAYDEERNNAARGSSATVPTPADQQHRPGPGAPLDLAPSSPSSSPSSSWAVCARNGIALADVDGRHYRLTPVASSPRSLLPEPRKRRRTKAAGSDACSPENRRDPTPKAKRQRADTAVVSLASSVVEESDAQQKGAVDIYLT